MRDLAARGARAASGQSLPYERLFVHLGTPEQGEQFFAKFDSGARAISDPEKELYAAFGLERGNLWTLLGPSVWANAAKSVLKGNAVGKPVGDPTMMPGLFLVHEGRVVWRQSFAHIGEATRLDELEAFARRLLPAA